MSEAINSLLRFRGQAPANPPLLILGQFERVGSTFYCDQLEKTHLIHNEPYKLLLPHHWPISRGYDGPLMSIDEFLESSSVDAVDKHWMRNFVASLHYPGGQIVKETNLYLTLPQFLELFPYSEIELLTRNPLGIISSFKRNDLYHRWNYADVSRTLRTQLEKGRPDKYKELIYMLDQGDTWEEKLAWMIGLNAVLLSMYIDPSRLKRIVSYEDDIIPLGSAEDISHDRVQDSIFGTNIFKTNDDFESRYTPAEIDTITTAMSDCTEYVQKAFGASKLHLFNQLYAKHLNRTYQGRDATVLSSLGEVSLATKSSPQYEIRTRSKASLSVERKLVQLDTDIPVLWDYSLVTNEQMGTFLQSMIDAGQDQSLNYLLLLDNMPPSRGGRITFDASRGSYMATEGFADHPAYWVSWLAASLYAYSVGMRLPSHAEWQKVYDDKYDAAEFPEANHTYAHDDTVPTGVGVSLIPADFFGNLKIWCSDWSNPQMVSKRLAGISWKHYFHDSYNSKTERPYVTNARWIGIRLVCCSECPAPESRGIDDVMAKFDQIVEMIKKTTVKTTDELSDLNEKIALTLTPPNCIHQNS